MGRREDGKQQAAMARIGKQVGRDRLEKFPADGSGGKRVGDQDTARSNREHDEIT